MTPINEQTILITGSTDGLGKATAVELAKLGASVLLHGRDKEKLAATVSEIKKASGNDRVRGYLADLSELSQVRQLAQKVISTHRRLDMLINNAGIGAGDLKKARRELSADGIELRFAVNYLAPFLLTRLLLPLIRKSAPSRIINVSSVGQVPIDFDDLQMEKRYEPFDAYRRSKLAQIMDTIDLSAELSGSGVTVNCLHPASLMNTKMVLEWFGHTMSTVEDGVNALMNMATSPEFDQITGAYFDQTRRSRPNPQAADPAARKRLKEASLALAGIEAV